MKRLSAAGVCLLVLVFLSPFAHAFTPTYVLTVDVTQGMDGYDRVVSDPPGIDCSVDSGDCTGDFLEGTLVALAAVPQNGSSWTSSFGEWGGACAGSVGEACALVMGSDASRATALSEEPSPDSYAGSHVVIPTTPLPGYRLWVVARSAPPQASPVAAAGCPPARAAAGLLCLQVTLSKGPYGYDR